MVGIKLADGGFYPVLDERGKTAKRLTLTTVRDEQTNVQIDLYRGETGKPLDAGGYIASLVLESIPAGEKGEADIELSLSLDEKGCLAALAKEVSTGEYQSLRINIDDQGFGDLSVPDFSFDGEEEEMISLIPESGEKPFANLQDEALPRRTIEEKAPDYEAGEDVTPNIPALTAFVLFGFIIVAALIYLFFSLTKESPVPFLEAAVPCIALPCVCSKKERK